MFVIAGGPMSQGPSAAVKRISQSKSMPVPPGYVQQDWQLLQASMHSKHQLS